MPKSICARAMVVESYCSYAQCWDWPSIDFFKHCSGITYPFNIAQYCVSFWMFSLVFLPKCKLGLYKVKSMLHEHISTDVGNRQEVSSILSLQSDINGNSKLCSIYFLVLLWFQVACVGLLLHGIFTVFANGLHLNKSNTNIDEHVWLIVHSHAGPTPLEPTFPQARVPWRSGTHGGGGGWLYSIRPRKFIRFLEGYCIVELFEHRDDPKLAPIVCWDKCWEGC